MEERAGVSFGSVSSGLFSIGEIVFYLAIAGSPLPFGSDEPSSVGIWCLLLAASCVLLACTAVSLARAQVAVLLLAGGIVGLYGVVLHEQLAEHPWFATYQPIWSQAATMTGAPVQPLASIVRGEPLFAVGPSIANVLALICGLLLGSQPGRGMRVLNVIAWSGATYAVYALFQFLLEPNMILWREKVAYLESLTGTFINRNTAAAYFGSAALIWLCLLTRQIRHHLGAKVGSWWSLPRRLLSNPPRSAITSFLGWFACLTSMFLTGSRAGVTLSLFAMVLVATVYLRRDLPKGYGLIVFAAGAGALALLLMQFLGGAVGNRFDVQGLADEGRLAAYRSMLKMIGDHPWFGTGLGTFQWAFAAYRSPAISMQGIWDIGHNVPLEMAAELGVPLATAVCLSWLALMISLSRRSVSGGREGLIALAALGASLIGATHSLVDFSFQVPGYSIPVLALVGAALPGDRAA